MPAVYKSNGARVGDRMGICRVSNNGQNFDLWIHVPDEPNDGHWSEIEVVADSPAPDPTPTPDPDPDPTPDPDPDPNPVPNADVVNAAELSAAINAAQAGDVILVAPGDYGSLAVNLKNWGSNPVTIKGVDPANKPRFTRITSDLTSGVIFESLHCKYDFNGEAEWHTATNFSRGSNVTLLNCDIEGDANGSAGFWATGVRSINVDAFTVEKCEVHKFTRGLFLTGENIVVRENEIHDIRSDGINPDRVTSILIEQNYIHDFGGVAGNSDHRDMIQVLGSVGSSGDITIRKNLFFQGSRYAASDSWTQTIWLGGDGRSGDNRHENLTIEDNLIVNSHFWGVGCFGVRNIVVAGNTIAEWPGGNSVPVFKTYSGGTFDIRGNVAPTTASGPSITHNDADYNGQSGNEERDLTPDEVMALAMADPDLAHHFGG